MELSKRMKEYEKVFYGKVMIRTPLIIRVDGRAFHSLKKWLKKPFDKDLMDTMVEAALNTAEDMQGFKVAYIQSDEVTFLLTDYDKLETQGWFGYELPKLISISASLMTAYFNDISTLPKLVTFDSRAFSLPKEEVVNMFLWRARDWKRNSLSMYCRSFFSHKELHKKKEEDMYEMLHSIGKNWSTDLSKREKNGTFLIKSFEKIETIDYIEPSYESIKSVIGNLF